MAGDKISNNSNTTHLGTYRDITDKPTCNIEEKNQLDEKQHTPLWALDSTAETGWRCV